MYVSASVTSIVELILKLFDPLLNDKLNELDLDTVTLIDGLEELEAVLQTLDVFNVFNNLLV